MENQKLMGIVLIVVGGFLLYFGWQSSQSLGEQLNEAFTGRYTNDTTLFLIGGAAAVVAGVVMAFSRK